MNKVMFIGNLTKDPEIRSTQSGMKTAGFSLAINDGKDKNGQEQVQYFNFTAFDKTAEVIERYVKKGHKLMVVGRLKNESWDKPDGTKGYSVKVVVSEVEMLTTKADAERINSMAGGDNTPAPTSSKSSKKKADDDELPEIDINNINVQMPF
jgi:single-strand DNA-binding protein